MIGGLAVLLVCQLIGELLAKLLHLPVPGPVIGMALLFCALLIRNRRPRASEPRDRRPQAPRPVPQGLEIAAQGLLQHLALLFVPAGTGIIAYAALIRQEWLPITITLLGSTLVTLAVTGTVMQMLAGTQRRRSEQEGDL